MIFPTTLRYAIATVNNRSTPDLSKAASTKVQESVKNQAGKIGFQENVTTDDESIVKVFPPADYRHTGISTENNLVIRESRFPPVRRSTLDKMDITPLKAIKSVDKHGNTILPLINNDGKIAKWGIVRMGTGKHAVQPQRTIAFDISEFSENLNLTPEVFISTHMISGVDSNKEPKEYRHEQRKVQWAMIVKVVKAFVAAGFNVTLVGDFNWAHLPQIIDGERNLYGGHIDHIRFIPSPKANWTLALVDLKPIESIDNPSDHNAIVANVELTTNKNYKPSDVPLPSTTEAKFVAILHKYHIDNNAEAELRAILSEV